VVIAAGGDHHELLPVLAQAATAGASRATR